MTNFRLLPTKEFADNNFKLNENSRTFFKMVENIGKRRNHSLHKIPLFPTVENGLVKET